MADEDDLGLTAHRFSMEAFEVAKAFAAGDGDAEALKARALELRERLPGLGKQIPTAPEEERADINQALSDADLDISYVLADGNGPSSIRLHHVLAEQ